jgi:hypothetical protein
MGECKAEGGVPPIVSASEAHFDKNGLEVIWNLRRSLSPKRDVGDPLVPRCSGDFAASRMKGEHRILHADPVLKCSGERRNGCRDASGLSPLHVVTRYPMTKK